MLSGLDDMKSSIASTVYNTGRAKSDYYLGAFRIGKNVIREQPKG